MMLPGIGGVDSALPLNKSMKKSGKKAYLASPAQDEVNISQAAKKMAKISQFTEQIKKMDEPSDERLSEIAERVDNGTYFDTVSADDIAGAILNR